jgi:flagellar hook protein FlgE
VYDSTGAAVSVTTVYWEASDSSDNITATGSGYLAYDTSGNILSGDYYTDAAMTTAVSPAFSSSQSITIAPATTSTAPNIAAFSIDVSMVGVTDHGSSSSTVTSSSDGYAAGDLSGFTISSDGIITGTYSNGQTQSLGQIALAVFTNPAGLDKVGSNFYSETVNSGAYTAGVIAGTGGSGELSSGTLETSNVDLSAQFSEMMIAQRAYQASSKLITVYDEMMQTVINAAG